MVVALEGLRIVRRRDPPSIEQYNPSGCEFDYEGAGMSGPTVLAMVARAFGFFDELTDAALINLSATISPSYTSDGLLKSLHALGFSSDRLAGDDIAFSEKHLRRRRLVIVFGDPRHEFFRAEHFVLLYRWNAKHLYVRDPSDLRKRTMTRRELESFLQCPQSAQIAVIGGRKKLPVRGGEELVNALCQEIQPFRPQPYIHPLVVEVSRRITPTVEPPDFLHRATRAREYLFKETGVQIPGIRFVASEELPEDLFKIRINGIVRYEAQLGEGNILIEIIEVLRSNAHRFLGVQEVANLLEEMSRRFPDLVREAKNSIELPALTRLLRTMVKEGDSIRDMWTILNVIAQEGPIDWRSYMTRIRRAQSSLESAG